MKTYTLLDYIKKMIDKQNIDWLKNNLQKNIELIKDNELLEKIYKIKNTELTIILNNLLKK